MWPQTVAFDLVGKALHWCQSPKSPPPNPIPLSARPMCPPRLQWTKSSWTIFKVTKVDLNGDRRGGVWMEPIPPWEELETEEGVSVPILPLHISLDMAIKMLQMIPFSHILDSWLYPHTLLDLDLSLATFQKWAFSWVWWTFFNKELLSTRVACISIYRCIDVHCDMLWVISLHPFSVDGGLL